MASTSAFAASSVLQDTPASSASTPEPTADGASTSAAASAVASTGDWQAIWSPQYNAYYFFNSKTQQTTWENPLQSSTPSDPSSTPSDPSSSTTTTTTTPVDPSSSTSPASAPITPAPAVASLYALQEAAAAQGIDPSLAYLDPSLAGPSGSAPGGSFVAKFNARTGAFARADARAPAHLSEYERAKRMSEVYFDVGAWEQEVEQRKQAEEEEGGRKRKRPSKKDLVSPPFGMFCFLALCAIAERSFVRALFSQLCVGTVQRAEETEEDRQDGVAAYIDRRSGLSILQSRAILYIFLVLDLHLS